MSVEALMTRPCQIVRRGPDTVDANYDPVTPEVVSQSTCYLEDAPTLRSQEGQGERDITRVNAICYLPAGTVVDFLDAVIVDGRTYELIGDPEVLFNPRTQTTSHLRCHVQRTTG